MKNKYIILLGAILVLSAFVTPASAVPTMQLYMPDATYYNVSPWFPNSGESWITTSNPFDLLVVGATSPSWVQYIDNVKLHIALLQDQYSSSLTTPLMTIKDNDPNINFEKTLYASDFSFGKPPGISKHGVYKTYYASVSLPNLMALSAGEAVYDYNADFDPAHPELSGSDTGDIQRYIITYDPRFSFIHFDATGVAHNNGSKSKNVFAPYSHDADVAPVPEPASLSLLGLGLLGMAKRIKRKT